MTNRQEPSTRRRQALEGLLWMDFRRHRGGFLIGLPSIALMALAIGRVENAGGPMFFWVGLALAIGCGAGFGRGELTAGVEEYSLALPPTRHDRYYVRFALGVAFLLVLLLLGLAAGPLGWVRAAWELTPFELPVYRAEAPLWADFDGQGFYVLVIGLTFATFAECYALAINSERADDNGWIARGVPFVVVALLVVLADRSFFSGHVGYASGALGLVYTLPRAHFGCRAFERKSAVFETTGAESLTAAKPSMALAIVVGLTVLATLAVWLYSTRG